MPTRTVDELDLNDAEDLLDLTAELGGAASASVGTGANATKAAQAARIAQTLGKAFAAKAWLWTRREAR